MWVHKLAVIVVGMGALLLEPRAKAGLIISLTNGASSVSITDGGAGDLCGAVDCVIFSGALGNYLINVSTGTAQNGVNPVLELNSINLTTQTNAGILTIAISRDGYTGSAPQFDFGVGGTSSLGASSGFAAYGGNSNALFDTSNLLGSFSFGSTVFADTAASGGGSTVDPYSLTIVATLNGIAPGSVSFEAALDAVRQQSAVPEPGAWTMFVLSGLSIGLLRRVRR